MEAKEKNIPSSKDGKVCTHCGEWKALECYDKKSVSKQGVPTFMSRCKSCRSHTRKQNLIKINSYKTTVVDDFEVIELEADDHITYFHEKNLRDIAFELIFNQEEKNGK